MLPPTRMRTACACVYTQNGLSCFGGWNCRWSPCSGEREGSSLGSHRGWGVAVGICSLVLEYFLYLFLRIPYDVYLELHPDGRISPLANTS